MINTLIVFIILILGIPFKFLKLLYVFLSFDTFRNDLELLYIKLYFELKSSKIEILDKVIYLNCYTIGKFLNSLTGSTSKSDALKLLINVKAVMIDCNDRENIKNSFIKMPLTEGKSRDGKIIFGPHFAYSDTIDDKINTMHATSNIPNRLLNNQSVDISLLSLTKKDARNPGIVISKDVKIQTSEKFKFVSNNELASVKYNNLKLFHISNEDYKYQHDKNMRLREAFLNARIFNYDPKVLSELRGNHYTFILLNSSNADFIREIDLHLNTFI